MAASAAPGAPAESNLAKFALELEAILKDAGHREMFGVELHPPTDE